MGDTGQIHVRVRSTADLLAVAEALEREAAARYRDLSARMMRQGDVEMADRFDALARMEDRHVSQIGDRCQTLLGHKPDVAAVKWEKPPGYDEDEARGAEVSVYRALAYAARNEERAFAFYIYLAAEAESDEIRALAEDMAREELEHAAMLRQYRRRAFHENRPATFAVPGTVDELHALARRLDAEAATAHAALAEALRAIGETADAVIFDGLAAEEAEAAEGVFMATAPRLRSVADGFRILEQGFDRYASIVERTDDERLIAEAQRLAGKMIARLAMAGGARSNTLLGR